jgi:hypothetical protein
MPESNENFLAEKLGTLLNGGLYLNIRDKVIKILPTHWVQRIIEIVSFQIGQGPMLSIFLIRNLQMGRAQCYKTWYGRNLSDFVIR